MHAHERDSFVHLDMFTFHAPFHIEAETKWLPFRQRNFQVHFLEWKLFYLKWRCIKICSLGSNWQYVSNGLDNYLANVGIFFMTLICVTRPQRVKGKDSEQLIFPLVQYFVQSSIVWVTSTSFGEIPNFLYCKSDLYEGKSTIGCVTNANLLLNKAI